MKRYIYALTVITMVALIGCSEEKAKNTRKVSDDDKPKVKTKKTADRPIAVKHKIVCDKFDLITTVTETTLELAIDTDLPDNTVIMVSVARSYLQKGNPATYSLEYFSEKSTVGKWRLKHQISIASEKWSSLLRDKQEELSKVGLGFEVASISNMINVRMTVPINQPDSIFGVRNENFTGKAVTMVSEGGKTITGDVVGPMYVVKGEIEISYPLNLPHLNDSPLPSIDPYKLDIGLYYILSKQTPLMPSHSPVDSVAAMKQIKQIPIAGSFKVLDVYMKNNKPWYKVIAFDKNIEEMGIGWINCTALLGQDLKTNK